MEKDQTAVYKRLFYRMSDERDGLVKAIFYAALLLLAACFSIGMAFAHEHTPGETAAQKRKVDFLQQWRRPKGIFAVEHRFLGCCYSTGENQDCFAVKQTRMVDGVREVFPDSEGHKEFDRWFKLDTGVNEDEQPDPKESPDGRSYVCIQGNQVVCYVGGIGS